MFLKKLIRRRQYEVASFKAARVMERDSQANVAARLDVLEMKFKNKTRMK